MGLAISYMSSPNAAAINDAGIAAHANSRNTKDRGSENGDHFSSSTSSTFSPRYSENGIHTYQVATTNFSSPITAFSLCSKPHTGSPSPPFDV